MFLSFVNTLVMLFLALHMALSHPYTTVDVAQSFLDNIFKLHEFQDSITSDRDVVFTSQ